LLGAVHKRRPQSAELSNVQCEHFSDKEDSSDADVRTFWRKKLPIFRNLLCVRTDKVEGVEPVRTFFGQGGSIFSQFCADVLYGLPLTNIFLQIQPSQLWAILLRLYVETIAAAIEACAYV